MIRMGLLSGEEVHTVQQKNVTQSRVSGGRDRWIVVSGIFRRRYVRGGAVLGTVRDIWGNLLREYRADYPGIILYQTVGLGVKTGIR